MCSTEIRRSLHWRISFLRVFGILKFNLLESWRVVSGKTTGRKINYEGNCFAKSTAYFLFFYPQFHFYWHKNIWKTTLQKMVLESRFQIFHTLLSIKFRSIVFTKTARPCKQDLTPLAWELRNSLSQGYWYIFRFPEILCRALLVIISVGHVREGFRIAFLTSFDRFDWFWNLFLEPWLNRALCECDREFAKEHSDSVHLYDQNFNHIFALFDYEEQCRMFFKLNQLTER